MFEAGWTDDLVEGSKNVVKGGLILGLGVPLALVATASIGFPVIPDFLMAAEGTRQAVAGVMAV